MMCAHRSAAALLAALVLVAVALGPQSPATAGPAGAAAAANGPWNLTIFHTNDAHGAFLPEPTGGRDDRAQTGGIVALARHLARERRTAAASLLLDAGDFMTGNPICELEVDGVRGGGWQDLRELVGYDAGVLGNHEFDLGRGNARALAARSRHPLLAADLLNERGEPEVRAAPVILERGGLRVGVMGVSCASLFGVTSGTRTGGLSLRNQTEVVREQMAALAPVTDLQVLISHSGVEADRRLARELADTGLDVIVGGHSHTRLSQPENVGGVLIVQAGSHLKYLGRLDLRVEQGRVVRHAGRLIQLTVDDDAAAGGGAVTGDNAAAGEDAAAADIDPELLRLAALYESRVRQEFGRVLGTAAVDWKRRRAAESNLGNWLTDCLRRHAGADVAFLNSGGIRKDLPAGPVTMLDVLEILPFGNELVTFEATGRELRRIARRNAEAFVHDRGGGLQVSGLTYAYRKVGDHVEVQDVRVGGRPVKDDRRYKVATADYVCQKADEYFDLPPPPARAEGVAISAVVADAIRAAGTVEARVEGRMRALDEERAGRPRR